MGQVKSLKRAWVKEDKILKLMKDKDGYFVVGLYKDRKIQMCKIARLVGFAFLEPVDGCETIDHINRVKTDNRLENLQWANRITQSLNRDFVLVAKHITIYHDKNPRRISHWKVHYRYNSEKCKCKYFMTKDLAQAFSDILDKTRLIPLKSKSV
jgi:hypothetical protein